MRTKKNTEHRTRPIQIKFRMTNKEYEALQKRLSATGLSCQEFMLLAITNATMLDAASRDKITAIHEKLKDIQIQARGMGTNFNQMAKVANTNHMAPSAASLSKMSEEVLSLGKEVAKVCRSLNPLIRNQTPKQP